jgi:protein-tyrosine sulfotransferase
MSPDREVFLIVGCQRSGSTLLESILAAHPNVRMIGEDSGSYTYFRDPAKLAEFSEEVVGLRIPMITHRLESAIRNFDRARVLFVLRDPRDVVISMQQLEMPDGRDWIAAHGHREIKQTLTGLPDGEQQEERLKKLYEETENSSDLRFGGLCWALKNHFIPLYMRSPLPTKLVRYEVLTTQPEPYLQQICRHLELEWSDRLLAHGNYSSGQFFGTDKGESIHRRSLGSYRTAMTLEERRELHSVIGPEAEMLGYVELFD